jgi:hypothetical protein
MDVNYNFKKCFKCSGYKCHYYNNKLPFLSKDVCSLCFGRKELCILTKPEVYKITECNNCNKNNYLNCNNVCDLCDTHHYICLCKENNVKYPYYIPY